MWSSEDPCIRNSLKVNPRFNPGLSSWGHLSNISLPFCRHCGPLWGPGLHEGKGYKACVSSSFRVQQQVLCLNHTLQPCLVSRFLLIFLGDPETMTHLFKVWRWVEEIWVMHLKEMHLPSQCVVWKIPFLCAFGRVEHLCNQHCPCLANICFQKRAFFSGTLLFQGWSWKHLFSFFFS